MFGPAAAIFSLLLILTGLAKVYRPEETSRALSLLGLPDMKPIGLGVGLVEVLAGVGALVLRNILFLGAQAVLYAGFTLWLVVALSRELPIATCGCLGKPDTPPYSGHLIVNVIALIFTVGAMLDDTDMVIANRSLLAIVAQIMVLTVGTALSWIVLDHGARLHGAMRS